MKRVTIGQFATITGLTARALRLYEREGLLQPALVEPETGYRYYHYDQVVQAERIRLLRSLDVSLDEIKRVLSDSNPNTLRIHIAEHRQRIEGLLTHYRQTVEALEFLGQHERLPFRAEIKEVSAQPYIYSRHTVTFTTINKTRVQAQAALQEFFQRRDLEPSGPLFSSGPNYIADHMVELSALTDAPAEQLFDDQMLPEIYTWPDTGVNFPFEVAFPVEHPVAPEGDFGCAVWPAGRCVSVVHLGPHPRLPLAHRAAVLYALEHQEEPRGRNRELFFTGPWDTDDTSHFRTEVQYQLA